MKEQKKNWFVRHKVLSVIMGLVLVGIIASAAGGGESPSSTGENSASSPQGTTAQTVKVGEAVRDGKFEFIVKGIECGKSSVGPDQYLTKAAQGQFCLLTLSVKNIGDQQQYFSQSDQKLLNTASQQYSPDSTATLYNSNNSDAFLAQINPGNSVEGVLVFDVPKDQTPTAAELHDSSFSSGARVQLQ